MIRCCLSCNLNGLWKVLQLFPRLQQILAKYEENFNVVPVTDIVSLDGEVTES